MIKDIKNHIWHYTILLLIILVGGFGFLSTSDKIVRFQIGVVMTLGYTFWGAIHHYLEKNLNFKIVIEYILIGLLAIVFLGGTLL